MVFERSTSLARPHATPPMPAATSTSSLKLSRRTEFNAFDLIDVKTLLERRLDAHVELTTRDGLHPRLIPKAPLADSWGIPESRRG
jgi:hypothetical protein